MKATNGVLESLLEAASTIRAELLKCRYGWTFSGDSSLNSSPNSFLLTSCRGFMLRMWEVNGIQRLKISIHGSKQSH